MPKVLIIFSGAGLIVHLNEGAKHRLNCYIKCYKEAGYEVDVLCLFKDLGYWKSLKKYVDNSVHWTFVPYLFPRAKNKTLALFLRYYKYLVGWFYSTIKHYDVVQSEVDGLPLRFIGNSSMRITDFHGDGYYEYTSKYTHKKWCSNNFLFDQVCSIKYSDITMEMKKEYDSKFAIIEKAIRDCCIDWIAFNDYDKPKCFVAISDDFEFMKTVNYDISVSILKREINPILNCVYNNVAYTVGGAQWIRWSLGIEKENKFMYRFIQKLFKSKPKNSGERFNYGLKESAVEDIVYEVSEEDLANYTESCMYIR